MTRELGVQNVFVVEPCQSFREHGLVSDQLRQGPKGVLKKAWTQPHEVCRTVLREEEYRLVS